MIFRLQIRKLLFTIEVIVSYSPFGSPTGNTATTVGAGNKSPTRKPAPGRTVVPTTYFPSYSPTISAKPSEWWHARCRISNFILNNASLNLLCLLIFVDISAEKPVLDSEDPAFTFFCGTSWDNADSTCGMRCPSGNSADCPKWVLQFQHPFTFLSIARNDLADISSLRHHSELECWAFTSCKEEKGIETPEPVPTAVPTIPVQYVPGFGGAQVPVFGGVDWSLLEPSISPVPSFSSQPIGEPEVSASDMLGTYFCGGWWILICFHWIWIIWSHAFETLRIVHTL